MMPLSRLLLAISFTLFTSSLWAQEPIENVILVTMDGLRWQELFGGADNRLIDKEIGNVDDPNRIREKFWRETSVERRNALMPFFWKVIAVEGQVFGDPEQGSQARVQNGRYFSYPGYNELLSGFADKRIDSNDKNPNENVTVLEWLHRKPQFEGKVAAFCSWDVFPFIINEQRSKIPVNAGWDDLDIFANESERKVYSEMKQRLPRYWQSVRYDIFTFKGALEYMKSKKPRLIYVGLGETDDWAHAGRYDLYLESARVNDDLIRELWEYAQSDETYRGKTALVITTDHGRGDGREGWKNHSEQLAGSENIWIAVMAPGVEALGVRKDIRVVQGQVATTVAHLLGKDFQSFDSRIESPLPLRLTPTQKD